MKKIIWSQSALIDLDNIHRYISQDSIHYANILCSDILQSVEQLQRFPRLGRKVPECREDDTREIMVSDYRIIYEVIAFRINVLTVIHGARLLKKS